MTPEIWPIEDATEIRKAQEIKTNAKSNQHSVKAVVIVVRLNRLPERKIIFCKNLKAAFGKGYGVD